MRIILANYLDIQLTVAFCRQLPGATC